MAVNCGQTNIPSTDETPLPCDEFIADRCIIHEAAISYLGLLENSTYDEVLEAYLLSLIDARNRVLLLEQDNTVTGWGDYTDTEYTSVSPLVIIGDDPNITLPNNAGSKIETQKPSDITTFYDEITQKILGRDGDGLNIVIEFKVRPTSGASNVRVQTSIDIGGAVGEIYQRDFNLSKGNGEEHYFLSSFSGYTLDTWEANGGTVKISSVNSNVEVYDIRYILTRTHKAK